MDAAWKKLTQVTFTALRNDFSDDEAWNHAMAIDDLCLTVDPPAGKS